MYNEVPIMNVTINVAAKMNKPAHLHTYSIVIISFDSMLGWNECRFMSLECLVGGGSSWLPPIRALIEAAGSMNDDDWLPIDAILIL
jgi:F0F1-type ATP synthase assembly protein I